MGHRGIADILVLDHAQIIEICVTETENEVKHKVRKYPDCCDILMVKYWEQYFNKSYTIIKHQLI